MFNSVPIHPRSPIVRLRIDLEAESADPLLAAYESGVDRTLIRQNLRLSVEERLANLQHWIGAMDEIRGVADRPRREPDS